MGDGFVDALAQGQGGDGVAYGAPTGLGNVGVPVECCDAGQQFGNVPGTGRERQELGCGLVDTGLGFHAGPDAVQDGTGRPGAETQLVLLLQPVTQIGELLGCGVVDRIRQEGVAGRGR